MNNIKKSNISAHHQNQFMESSIRASPEWHIHWGFGQTWPDPVYINHLQMMDKNQARPLYLLSIIIHQNQTSQWGWITVVVVLHIINCGGHVPTGFYTHDVQPVWEHDLVLRERSTSSAPPQSRSTSSFIDAITTTAQTTEKV